MYEIKICKINSKHIYIIDYILKTTQIRYRNRWLKLIFIFGGGRSLTIPTRMPPACLPRKQARGMSRVFELVGCELRILEITLISGACIFRQDRYLGTNFCGKNKDDDKSCLLGKTDLMASSNDSKECVPKIADSLFPCCNSIKWAY